MSGDQSGERVVLGGTRDGKIEQETASQPGRDAGQLDIPFIAPSNKLPEGASLDPPGFGD